MNIAVYCSAKDSIPAEYMTLGDMVGQMIAQSGHTLIYGGATGGLMSRTSTACKNAGGKVIGVIPERIICAGRQASCCDELHIVPNMSARKQTMRTLADVSIALPGSYGTMDELFDWIASATVGEHHKPIIILNYKGFYDGLKHEIKQMKELAFLPQEETFKPVFADTMEELKVFINTQNV